MRQRYLKFAAGVLAMLLLLSGCSIEKVSTGELSTTEPETTVEDTTQPAPETTAEPEKETVSIIMVGDVLLHEKVAESGKRDDGTYNYDHFFANVKDEIQGADIAIVNQEVILGGKELGLTGYPSFNGAFEVGDAEACVRKQPLRLWRRGVVRGSPKRACALWGFPVVAASSSLGTQTIIGDVPMGHPLLYFVRQVMQRLPKRRKPFQSARARGKSQVLSRRLSFLRRSF